MGYLVLLSILAAFTIWGCWISVSEGCYDSIKAPLEAGSYFEVRMIQIFFPSSERLPLYFCQDNRTFASNTIINI